VVIINVDVETITPSGMQKCTLRKVLYVPELAFNLLSVSEVGKQGKITSFDGNECTINNEIGKTVPKGY